jgi:hypothetical protein
VKGRVVGAVLEFDIDYRLATVRRVLDFERKSGRIVHFLNMKTSRSGPPFGVKMYESNEPKPPSEGLVVERPVRLKKLINGLYDKATVVLTDRDLGSVTSLIKREIASHQCLARDNLIDPPEKVRDGAGEGDCDIQLSRYSVDSPPQ